MAKKLIKVEHLTRVKETRITRTLVSSESEYADAMREKDSGPVVLEGIHFSKGQKVRLKKEANMNRYSNGSDPLLKAFTKKTPLTVDDCFSRNLQGMVVHIVYFEEDINSPHIAGDFEPIE